MEKSKISSLKMTMANHFCTDNKGPIWIPTGLTKSAPGSNERMAERSETQSQWKKAGHSLHSQIIREATVKWILGKYHIPVFFEPTKYTETEACLP